MYSDGIWEICQNSVAPRLNVSFEERLPWAEVFSFSSDMYIFRTKGSYINSRLTLSFSGSQLAPFLDVQDAKRLVNALVKVSEYCISQSGAK